MSLYQKLRPNDFSQVKGNDTIIQSLEGFLAEPEKCPHAFLFHGETGCGKTTIARILASRLGCVGSDFYEYDIASMRGIDTVRDIRQNAMYMPIEGECKVYCLDECQKMTADAQNALLKILEDTPRRVYFILCTTEPNKLLAPIRNRCSQFQVKTLGDVDMRNLLKRAIRSEGKKVASEVIDQIVLDAMGHPRSALTILEQVLSVPEETQLAIAAQTAQTQLQGIELCRLLMNPKSTWKQVSAVLRGLKEQDAEGIRRIVLGYCTSVLLNTQNDRCGLILECMMEPNFTNGFPQLVFHCYEVVQGGRD